jgi:hypothetical protein
MLTKRTTGPLLVLQWTKLDLTLKNFVTEIFWQKLNNNSGITEIQQIN